MSMSGLIRFFKWFLGILGSLILLISLVVFIGWRVYRGFVDEVGKAIPESVINEFPLSAKVNPFIGTGGVPWTCAYNFPGASLPFGMVRLSPETAAMVTDALGLNTSGYFYGDDKIIGFSHTRLVGTGATDGGHFLIQPVEDNDIQDPSMVMHKYSHADELAYPGYYHVGLPDKGIKVELTATERVGLHRYTFDKPSGFLLNVTHALGGKRSEDGFLRVVNNQHIEGYVRTFGSFAGRYGGIKVYFAARFSSPFISQKVWQDSEEVDPQESHSSNKLISLFGFDKEEVQIRLAISHVSIKNAWENMEAEVGEKTFKDVLNQATQTWEDRLSSIEIKGGSKEQQKIFYTALFRSLQMPTRFNDVDGKYIGFDKAIHEADSFQYYTDMSIWDTFRTTHPLYTLIAPDDQRDMIVSLTRMTEQGGWLPRWPSGHGYTNSMLGTASDIVISEAYQKGIRDFDVEFAYQNMKEIALNPMPKGAPFSGREGNGSCRNYGYCPADSMDEAVSRTLEFSWSDYSISLLADALGKEKDAVLFHDLSMNYKNTWNPETQFFQARNADGKFDEHFKPLLLTYVDGDETYTNDYVEGSAMQWRWAPFFDPGGLIGLFTSKDYFVSELDNFFRHSDTHIGHWYPGSYYWHGNEPDVHSVYLFNEAGRPDLTQKWVRWIMEHKYADRYDGLDGNDDGGTLSAWYVFSALGFYPVAGTDTYQLGAPLFEEATVDMGNRKLEIRTKNFHPDNIYVKSVTLNGVILDRTWFKHHEIVEGATLEFDMSDKPMITK